MAVIDDLGLVRPPLSIALDQVSHPLINKAQNVPEQVQAAQSRRIQRLKLRPWYRVKVDEHRGGTTRLSDSDDLASGPCQEERYRWWLCLCGTRADDSPQRDFYDQVDDASAEQRLPCDVDVDRILAELGLRYVRILQENVRKSAYRSLQSNRFIPLEYGDDHRVVTAIRAFPNNETYMSIAANLKSKEDFVTALSAFEGISPDDWQPEYKLPVDILGNTEGQIVFSTLFTPEAQEELLKEGDIKGWPKGWN